MLISIFLLMLTQRGIVTIFDDGMDVIPLRAFFDRRPIIDGHSNALVILLQAKKSILNGERIIECGIGEETASSFKVLHLDSSEDYIHRFSPSTTHEEAVVLCYDLKLSRGKAKPFVTYQNAYGYPIRIETKSELVINNDVKKNSSGNIRVLVCATQVRGTEWLLKEWIQYQKNLGVDFIHLYTEQNLVDLAENRHSGFLCVDQWPSLVRHDNQLHSLQTMDCLYRYQGLFDYVLVYDTSDYFVLMMEEKADIKDYITLMFSSVHTGSVLLRRVVYSIGDGCKFKADLNGMNMHSNISEVLSQHDFKELDLVTKSIHKISAAKEITPQKSVSLMPGYVTQRASPEIAYIVHIRNGHSLKCKSQNHTNYF